MINIIRNWVRFLLMFFCIHQSVEANENTHTEFIKKIEEVRETLSNISQELDKLKKRPYVNALPGTSLYKETSLIDKINKIEDAGKEYWPVHDDRGEGSQENLHSLGFYILPFAGLTSSHNLTWQSFAGGIEINEGIGTSSGLSIGYEKRNFFSDIQISYIHNRMKSMGIPLSFSGESNGLGIHLTGGSRIHFNHFFSYSLGGGIGGFSQEISFLLSGISVEKEDLVMSYQIFSGFQFRPTEFTSIGLRYRWLKIEEMNPFSDRGLHLLELSLGYFF